MLSPCSSSWKKERQELEDIWLDFFFNIGDDLEFASHRPALAIPSWKEG